VALKNDDWGTAKAQDGAFEDSFLSRGLYHEKVTLDSMTHACRDPMGSLVLPKMKSIQHFVIYCSLGLAGLGQAANPTP